MDKVLTEGNAHRGNKTITPKHEEAFPAHFLTFVICVQKLSTKFNFLAPLSF